MWRSPPTTGRLLNPSGARRSRSSIWVRRLSSPRKRGPDQGGGNAPIAIAIAPFALPRDILPSRRPAAGGQRQRLGMKRRRALGIEVSPTLLATADEIIEIRDHRMILPHCGKRQDPAFLL